VSLLELVVQALLHLLLDHQLLVAVAAEAAFSATPILVEVRAEVAAVAAEVVC
jgi:hypothetical protein